jgi:hypothetical protein
MKKIVIVFIMICIVILGSGSAGAVNPKISSRLAQLIEKHKTVGVKGAKKFTVQSNIEVAEESVLVVLEIQPDQSLESESLVPYNGEVKGRYRNLVETRIPIGELENIAENFTQIQRIRLPLKPHPVETSEGVSLTAADTFQNSGYKGSGTKIAIIDIGFIDYPAAQSNGDLPSTVYTHDYGGGGVESETNHGTAVAEIVYDMAPEAELHLMKIATDVQLGNAKNECKSLGIDIVNHSVAWFNSGPGDGTGSICDIADDAYDNGILWINSAGNAARKHWQGAFTDSNSNGRHEFDVGDESNTVTVSGSYDFDVCLRWNDRWNNSSEDYDLWILNDGGQIVAKSENRQNGSAFSHPIEEITIVGPTAGGYHVVVVTHSITGGHEIELFSLFENFEHIVTTGSICEPADSSKVLAVGAIFHNNWSDGPQEYFSSLGPTNDSRTKPDSSGPDGVESYTYGSAFYGTSAASPHVAGAASLILCRNNTYTAAQLWQKLEQDAQDIGSPGKDNTYGSGKLSVKGISILNVSNTSLNFGKIELNRSKVLSFIVTNTGGGTLNGTISDDREWITVDPVSFNSSSQTVYVLVDNSVLNKPKGEYTGTVTVDAGSAGTETVAVSVLATCVFTRPNPYNPRNGKLTFFGSGVPGGTIKIYTLAGELVKTLEETTGSETIEWDGRNEQDDEVISGIYLYTTKNDAEKNACSFTIIKK